jgi:hypothetical protein
MNCSFVDTEQHLETANINRAAMALSIPFVSIFTDIRLIDINIVSVITKTNYFIKTGLI